MSTTPGYNVSTDTLGLIVARGSDAASFLNAQLTRRVDNLADGELALAAWCNAKGRVLALFRVSRRGDEFALWLPSSMVPLTLPRLRMFVLRAQVSLEASEAGPVTEGNGRLADVLAGIPQVYPQTRELFLPQMLNLDQLGGIDFKKGCYPGQEIVARTQYLGKLKRQLQGFSLAAGAQPEPGNQLVAAGDQTGIVVEAAPDNDGIWRLLAVVPNEYRDADWRLQGSDGPCLRPGFGPAT